MACPHLIIRYKKIVEVMKKAICILASAFLLSGGAVFAQGEMDAYKFSQYDLSGTARYLGMGGAFGALGGDISAMGGNPAGLGIYRSSEIVTTLSLSSMKTNTEWSGTKMDENRTKFNFDNIAYVGYFPTGNDEGLIGWNVGFAYNRVKNFNRRYRMGRGPGGFSLSDYIATLTNRAGVTGNDLLISDSHDPYMNQDWLSVMGYDTYIIGSANPSQKGGFHSSFGTGVDGTWQNWEVQQADMYYTLETTGLKAKGFAEGTAFMEALAFDTPELILLDIMLPGEDGLELLKKLKNSAKTKDIPVIMVTAKGAEYDKVIGLDSGADDYVTKPFGMMELVSRIKAVLRRSGRVQEQDMLSVNGVSVDVKKHEVKVAGEIVTLTLKEFELLERLMRNQNIVLTRDQLLEDIWGYDFDGETRTVDVHVRTLRQKLGEKGDIIKTVRGVGYRIGGGNEG